MGPLEVVKYRKFLLTCKKIQEFSLERLVCSRSKIVTGLLIFLRVLFILELDVKDIDLITNCLLLSRAPSLQNPWAVH